MDKIKVIITNKQKDVKIPTGLRMLIRRCCNAVLKMEKFEGSVEVSVTLVNNKQIRELNSIYRNIDRVTDVLSFPMTDEGEDFTLDPETGCYMLGDIVISLEKALAQADEYGHSFKREVAFLTVHSMLHLLGYDHERSEEEEREMFGKQEIVLEAMGLTR